jgi:hypothetical protein
MTEESLVINQSHYDRYLKCTTCGAKRGSPCFSLRTRFPKPLIGVHPGRPMNSGRPTVIRPGRRPTKPDNGGVSVEDWLSQHGEPDD